MEKMIIEFPTERLARYQKEEAELAYQIERLENEIEYLDRKREIYCIRIEEIEKLRYPEEQSKAIKELNPNAIKESIKKFEDKKAAQDLNSDMDAYIEIPDTTDPITPSKEE